MRPYEGVFRRPRLKTNVMLSKFSSLFFGSVLNVSGSNDSDKSCSLYNYYFSDYDSGKRYKDYFSAASSYLVSNYPNDETVIDIPQDEQFMLDLEADLPGEYIEQFDVVFNHTVLEHVFDIFKAFENLCALSRDVVILVVPQAQKIHDYGRGYADYWRMTPFAVERLFDKYGFTILHRDATGGFSESIYLFYIASKKPERWRNHFDEVCSIEEFLTPKNDGTKMTLFSHWHVRFDQLVRRFLEISGLTRR